LLKEGRTLGKLCEVQKTIECLGDVVKTYPKHSAFCERYIKLLKEEKDIKETEGITNTCLSRNEDEDQILYIMS